MLKLESLLVYAEMNTYNLNKRYILPVDQNS